MNAQELAQSTLAVLTPALREAAGEVAQDAASQPAQDLLACVYQRLTEEQEAAALAAAESDPNQANLAALQETIKQAAEGNAEFSAELSQLLGAAAYARSLHDSAMVTGDPEP